ncbi:HNH endonuclease [Cryptosporangium arvum]|uniref:Restriction endonuclease n=1 Tax=Cryptosporangium arvum DSM 44712 TaxID=927661 RepID=A0A010ZS35_9ACTN|nr:restriction endonuclease [Cryptosporangium arvum DSM 44712]
MEYRDAAHLRGTQAWKRARAYVLKHSRTCWICGHGGADSVDHIVPMALGGAPLDFANLAPAHMRCNSRKGKKPIVTKLKTSQNW